MALASETAHLSQIFDFDDLPALPIVMTTLMSVDPDSGENHFADILSLAHAEPCLALRILDRAARGSELSDKTSLSRALTRIGVAGIHSIVTAQSAARVFLPTKLPEKVLWLHSIQTAVGCAEIATLLPQLRLDPERAFLAGLLHDIGRIVQYELSSEAPSEVDATGFSSPAELLEAEKRIFGCSHVDIAVDTGILARLPHYLSTTIRYHHDPPGQRQALSRDVNHFIDCVQLADMLSVRILRRGRSGAEHTPLPADKLAGASTCLKTLHADPKAYNRVVERMCSEGNRYYEMLQLGKSPIEV
jgi:HD-like signal output (HDOD) protein